MAHLPEGVRASIRLFAFYVGNGTVDLELLPEESDYWEALVEFGSDLEMVFAIFTNVLEYDGSGQVTNHGHAQRRAAQWIRSYIDPDYQVTPPFEDWELVLA